MDPVVREYTSNARTYDRKWSFYVESSTRETLARLSMNPTDRVLDVGCGTGELLSRLAARYPEARLAGLDPVAEMLSIAQIKLSDAVDLRVGWANKLPWEDASFDVVVSCNMFHYITQCAALLRGAAGFEPKIERYKISWLWRLMTAIAEKKAA